MLFITISGFLSLKIGLSKSDDIAYIIRNPIRKYLRFVIPFGLAFIILQISYLLGAYNHFDNVFEKSIVHLSMGRENPIIPVSWYELLKAINDNKILGWPIMDDVYYLLWINLGCFYWSLYC